MKRQRKEPKRPEPNDVAWKGLKVGDELASREHGYRRHSPTTNGTWIVVQVGRSYFYAKRSTEQHFRSTTKFPMAKPIASAKDSGLTSVDLWRTTLARDEYLVSQERRNRIARRLSWSVGTGPRWDALTDAEKDTLGDLLEKLIP